MTFFYILLATVGTSLLSLTGLLVLMVKHSSISKFVFLLVSLAAGTLMGAAFLHLLPEAIEELGTQTPFYVMLVSFVVFFIIEKVLHWRHCHDDECEVHTFGYMNLIGDAIHNFIDGIVIAAAFTTSPEIGIATTLAIALHEIPQEMGDLGVLLHSGFSKTQALMANFVIALTAVLGGITGYFLVNFSAEVSAYLLPIAAGGFLYIASSDLMPELRKEKDGRKSTLSLVLFSAGIFIMFVTSLMEH